MNSFYEFCHKFENFHYNKLKLLIKKKSQSRLFFHYYYQHIGAINSFHDNLYDNDIHSDFLDLYEDSDELSQI